MLDDEIVVAALTDCVTSRGGIERTLSYHFAFAQAVDNLAVATGEPRELVESGLKEWLTEHNGGMVSAEEVRESPLGPLPIIRYARLPAAGWERLLEARAHGMDT